MFLVFIRFGDGSSFEDGLDRTPNTLPLLDADRRVRCDRDMLEQVEMKLTSEKKHVISVDCISCGARIHNCTI